MKNIGLLVLRRLAYLIPVILLATFGSFLLVNFAPGSIALAILGTNATPFQVHRFDIQNGLNHPLLWRYGQWLWQAVHLNFGHSYETGQTVNTLIAQRFPVTAELVLLALILALLTAIPVSMLVARRPMKFMDWSSRSISMVGLSVPNYVVGIMLLYIFAVRLHWVPSLGYVPITTSLTGNLKVMVLPAVTLAFAFFATYTRILRGDMIDQLMSEEYVQTAKSKGLSEWRIVVRHVFKNSIFSFITVVGTNVGVLIGGTVIIEQVFTLAGMGQLLQGSILNRDSPVVQGLITVVCIAVVAANLVTDIAYTVLDPRVRYGASN